jgi:NAD(P)-dependent dehydrogenase (short-subunit alcohol dehydrogenase family)
MMRDITNMSVAVTGGGSGLGEGVARWYAARGARVTICGRRRDRIEAVAAALGRNCLGLALDVTRDADRRRFIAEAARHGGSLDLLVNNAANMYRGPITGLDEARLLDVFNGNVVAPMLLSGLAVEHLAARGGAIIFIGSVHTRRAFPGASPYAATKGAVEALTKVLAAELGSRKVRVGCVVPGAVPTELNIRAGLFSEAEHDARMNAIAPLHALGRVGTEEEIAEAIDHLARAEWTTGASLVVDGGLSLGLSNF